MSARFRTGMLSCCSSVIVLAFTACASVSPPAAATKPVSTVPPAAAPGVAAPSKPSPAPSRHPIPASFYRGMTPQLASFLRDLRTHMENGDWKWVTDRAERSHYRALVTNRHMGTDEYLRYLFRIGMDYRGRFPDMGGPVPYFAPSAIWDVQYLDARSDGIVTTVYGYVYTRDGKRLDFAVDVLDKLNPILLSGSYP